MRALRCDIGTPLFDQRGVAVAHRMRHHNKRQRHVADAFSRHLRQRCKGGTHDCNRRHTQRFEFGRVTRGPRG